VDLTDLPALVVDDNQVNRLVLRDLLTRWKMRPTIVDSGTAAIEALIVAREQGHPFSLVLLDANMPDMDGFEVARRIKESARLAGPTIMMLSSSGQHGETARCRSLGIANHLTKPVEQRELLAAIRRALAAHDYAGRAHALPGSMLPSQPPERRLHVLLAEDNVVNQRLAASVLERRGHRVTISGNGKEALTALDHHRFDIVLMDVQMPEMGGFDTTFAIRERERSSGGHLPIIAMTAHAMKGDRERCLEGGMDEYISKPLEPKLLCALVERMAGLTPEAGTEPAAAMPDGFEALLTRLGGDAQLLADISRLFIDDAPRHLSEIRGALDQADAGALRSAAHGLKGAAANFEASEVVDAARRLEEMGRASDLAHAEEVWSSLRTAMGEMLIRLQTFVQHS